MMVRSRFWRYAAPAVLAFGSGLAAPALAQPRRDAGAADEGNCMTSGAQLECPERCPSFETCSVMEDDALRVYYRVDDQRFDCDGIACAAASERLGDYCCERGEFAPSTDDGCGCSLVGARGQGRTAAGAPGSLGAYAACIGVALAICRRRRAAERLG